MHMRAAKQYHYYVWRPCKISSFISHWRASLCQGAGEHERVSKKEHMKKKKKGITQEEIRAETNANWFSDPCATREPSHWTYCQSDLTVENVVPPTLLTLHIPHAAVLFSFFVSLSQLPGSANMIVKFHPFILNGWMDDSWYRTEFILCPPELKRRYNQCLQRDLPKYRRPARKGFSLRNTVDCKGDYCRCCQSLISTGWHPHMNTRAEGGT